MVTVEDWKQQGGQWLLSSLFNATGQKFLAVSFTFLVINNF